ncbi:hypothetical protein EDD16DRAFT_1436479, partial [Pisolithus croceorrhizus]
VASLNPVCSLRRETCPFYSFSWVMRCVRLYCSHHTCFVWHQQPAPGRSHPIHLPLQVALAFVIDSATTRSAMERRVEV